MADTALAALRLAIEQAWSGGARAVLTQPLVELAGAQSERPAALRDVLNLRDGVHSRVVIGLVTLSDATVDAAGFKAARDSVRRCAHYLAMNLNPPSLTDDAQIWAVAPTGTNGIEAWTRLRAEVHQDTWSLPKSVWLPGTEPDPSSFLREGPLATPWRHSGALSDEQFDLQGRFGRRLGTKRKPWERERVQALLDVLNGTEDPESVATKLLHLAENA